MYFRICPECGAYLDPGEACDCKKEPPPEAATSESGKAKSTIGIVAEQEAYVK